MRRWRIKVTGDVQGVFYRFSAKMEAEKLGITGFGENESDDSVLIIAEGEQEALEKFSRWLKEGPPMAEVEDVQIEEDDYTGEFKGFEVR